MTPLQFSCTLENQSDVNDLAVEMWMDNSKFFDSCVAPGEQHVVHELSEDASDHVLKIVLKNKTQDHTTVDTDGNIVSDVLITVKNFAFDDIHVDQLFYENSTYTHDCNGSAEITAHEFFGPMGCNGTVEFQFSTPFYIWLLEHM
jgi:hypothetical protein